MKSQVLQFAFFVGLIGATGANAATVKAVFVGEPGESEQSICEKAKEMAAAKVNHPMMTRCLGCRPLSFDSNDPNSNRLKCVAETNYNPAEQ